MNDLPYLTHLGFIYDVTLRNRRGEIIDFERVKNLMPIQGMDHLLTTVLKDGAKVTQWYLSVYGNPYTPISADVMSTFPTLSGELTDYNNAQRYSYTPGTVLNGTVDNVAAPVEVVFPVERTVYGGFLASSAGKGSASGILLSAVRFASPKQVEAGASLSITAGFSFISI